MVMNLAVRITKSVGGGGPAIVTPVLLASALQEALLD